MLNNVGFVLGRVPFEKPKNVVPVFAEYIYSAISAAPDNGSAKIKKLYLKVLCWKELGVIDKLGVIVGV